MRHIEHPAVLLHVQIVGLRNLHFFFPPLHHDDLPWLRAKEVMDCCSVRKVFRQGAIKTLSTIKPSVYDEAGFLLIPHFSALPIIEAMIETGRCGAVLKQQYREALFAALDKMMLGCSDAEKADHMLRACILQKSIGSATWHPK